VTGKAVVRRAVDRLSDPPPPSLRSAKYRYATGQAAVVARERSTRARLGVALKVGAGQPRCRPVEGLIDLIHHHQRCAGCGQQPAQINSGARASDGGFWDCRAATGAAGPLEKQGRLREFAQGESFESLPRLRGSPRRIALPSGRRGL